MKDVAINVEMQISLLDPDFSPLGTYLRVRLLDHTLILFLFEETSYCFPEKAMAPHSSILAWKIPWTEGPGGLQSMGSLRVGHN